MTVLLASKGSVIVTRRAKNATSVSSFGDTRLSPNGLSRCDFFDLRIELPAGTEDHAADQLVHAERKQMIEAITHPGRAVVQLIKAVRERSGHLRGFLDCLPQTDVRIELVVELAVGFGSSNEQHIILHERTHHAMAAALAVVLVLMYEFTASIEATIRKHQLAILNVLFSSLAVRL